MQTEDISPGIELLCSIIIRENVNLFNRIDEKWFTNYDDELRLYKFVKSYYNKNPHGKLPKLDTCKKYSLQYNLTIIEPIGDPSDYFKIIDDRYTINTASDIAKEFNNISNAIRGSMLDGLTYEKSDEIKTNMKKFLTDSLIRLESGKYESFVTTFDEQYTKFRKVQFENRYRNHELGAMTPYDSINTATNGIKRSEWVLITGNMKKGKSYNWLNIIADMWLRQGLPTMITSMEMDTMDEYGTSGTFPRLMAIISQLNPSLIRTGLLPDVSLELIDKKIKHYKDMSVYELGNLPPLYFVDGEKSKSLDMIYEQAKILQPVVLGIDAIYKAEPRGKTYIRDQWQRERQVCEDRRAMCRDLKTINIDTHQFKKDALRLEKDEVLADNVGGVASWTQDPNYVWGILPEGDDNNKRRFVHIAGRDGAEFKSFVTNFKFDPRLDFSEIVDYNIDEGYVDESGEYEL